MLRARPPAQDGSPVDERQRLTTLEGRKVPEELVSALDAGVNPDEFLRETFKAAKRDNQISRGKCEALSLLAAHMLAEAGAGDAMPQEAAEYRRLLGL